MIFDSLANAASYRSMSPAIALGFDWLKNKLKPDTPLGRHDIDGDNVFALVQAYDTVAPSAKKFEAHRVYLDIQYVAAGNEIIYYVPLADLPIEAPYDAKKEVQLYGEPKLAIPLYCRPGDFAIFLPQDGHKPGCIHNAPSIVRKVVIKARV